MSSQLLLRDSQEGTKKYKVPISETGFSSSCLPVSKRRKEVTFSSMNTCLLNGCPTVLKPQVVKVSYKVTVAFLEKSE